MRTIIDIPQELLTPLDQLAKDKGVSRAALLREMIGEQLREIKPVKLKSLRDHPAFGMCKGTDDFDGLDGLAYQRKIRSEWDDRDRDIDRRLGLLPDEDQ